MLIEMKDLRLCFSLPGKTEKVSVGKNTHLHKFYSSELGQRDSKDNKFPSKSFLKCHWQQNREGATKSHVNLIIMLTALSSGTIHPHSDKNLYYFFSMHLWVTERPGSHWRDLTQNQYT